MSRAPAVVVLATALSACTVLAQEQREVVYEERFEVRAGSRLVADLGDMDIWIETGSGTTATVEVVMRARNPDWGREVFQRMRFEARAAGGGLTLAARDPDIDWREWRDRGGAGFVARVRLPEQFDLDLRTGDGDVRVDRSRGTAEIETGDGDLSIGRLSGPSIRLHTSDGDVVADELEAEQIELRTSDGDIRVDRLAGRLDARTGDGDVRIAVARFAGLSVQTSDGDISVEADASIGADVELRGEDLYVDEAFGLSGRVRSRSISGAVNGGGPRLTLGTGDGEVALRAR